MRLIRNTTQNSENESTASSVKSVESYGEFDSACSDCSECEYALEAKRHHMYHTRARCTSYGSIEKETYPLLMAPNLTNTYKSISTSSDTLGPAELSGSDIIATYKRTMQKELNDKTDKTKQSSLVTIFSIWNTIMGSSLLTMAWGVERAGLPTALFLLAFMAALCLYTAYILLRVNAHHGSATCEVPALCRTLLGAGAAAAAHTCSLLVLLGANVVYWLLITNFLYHTVNYFMDVHTSNTTVYNSSLLCPKNDLFIGTSHPVEDPSPYWSLRLTVPMYVAIIIFPLLTFKKITFFTKLNSLGTLSVFYLLIFVIVKGWTWGINISGVTFRGGGSEAAVLSGMLALSFYIHNIIITIMSNNEKQENNGRDLTIAFMLVTVTYALVGAVFYICFPLAKSCIEDNILNNFEMHDVMTAIARILLLFQVVTVFPMLVFLLRAEAVQLCASAAAPSRQLALSAAVVALCVAVACLYPDVGTLVRYTGAVSGLVHEFALPSLLQMRSLQLRGKLTLWKIIFYSCIIIFGTVNLVMQFFIT